MDIEKKQFSDAELLRAIRGENMDDRNAALKYLYTDAIVNNKIRQLVSEFSFKSDADDILQEGIILLDELIRAGKFRGEASVKTFLMGVCKNLIRNNARKIERISFKENLTDADFSETDYSDVLLLVEATEMEQERDNLLIQAMDQITPGCREVLDLYYFKAYNLSKVAQERGLANAEQAKKAAHRCREQLRSLISAQPKLLNFFKQWR